MDDPFDLHRFLKAQQTSYESAISELKAGQKQSHWMWYVFPQIDGLAYSSTAKYYSIKSVEEAQAYLQHALLGPRLTECAEILVGIEGRSISEILGSPDDLKLRSSATLFASLSPSGSVFERILKKYYGGVGDERTLAILEELNEKKVD